MKIITVKSAKTRLMTYLELSHTLDIGQCVNIAWIELNNTRMTMSKYKYDLIFYGIILAGLLFVAFDIGRMIGEARYCTGRYNYDYGNCIGVSGNK
jgi:hypothetical protein